MDPLPNPTLNTDRSMKFRTKSYTPNEIPAWDRVRNIAISGSLLVYGAHGVWVNDLSIRFLKRRYGGELYHLHNGAAVLMYIGFIFLSVAFISEVVDHYDRRDNEKAYKQFFVLCMLAGIGFSFLAYLVRT